jgi:hypothetical protein
VMMASTPWRVTHSHAVHATELARLVPQTLRIPAPNVLTMLNLSLNPSTTRMVTPVLVWLASLLVHYLHSNVINAMLHARLAVELPIVNVSLATLDSAYPITNVWNAMHHAKLVMAPQNITVFHAQIMLVSLLSPVVMHVTVIQASSVLQRLHLSANLAMVTAKNALVLPVITVPPASWMLISPLSLLAVTSADAMLDSSQLQLVHSNVPNAIHHAPHAPELDHSSVPHAITARLLWMAHASTVTHSVVTVTVKDQIAAQNAQSDLRSSRLNMAKHANAKKDSLQWSKDHSNVRLTSAIQLAEHAQDQKTLSVRLVLQASCSHTEIARLSNVMVPVSHAMVLLPITVWLAQQIPSWRLITLATAKMDHIHSLRSHSDARNVTHLVCYAQEKVLLATNVSTMLLFTMVNANATQVSSLTQPSVSNARNAMPIATSAVVLILTNVPHAPPEKNLQMVNVSNVTLHAPTVMVKELITARSAVMTKN